MKKISIVGFGRFGKTLYSLLKDDFEITLYNRSKLTNKEKQLLLKSTTIATDIKEIYLSDTIFFAVPIGSFSEVIQKHKKFFNRNHLLVDTLSVKMFPKRVFEKELKTSKARAILTHPMFGPDSSKNGFEGLKIVIDKFSAHSQEHTFFKKYLENKGLVVLEMDANTHDKNAASSQAVLHFVARVLGEVGFNQTLIDPLSVSKLHEACDFVLRDKIELSYDLIRFNPYAKEMIKKFTQKNKILGDKLL